MPLASLLILMLASAACVAEVATEGLDFEAIAEHAVAAEGEFSETIAPVVAKQNSRVEKVKSAAAAVAVAEQLLKADQHKAAALIDKAQASGLAKDQTVASKAVGQARVLATKLMGAKVLLAKAISQEKKKPESSLPARNRELAQKQSHALQKANQAKARAALQKKFMAQYGVKQTCHKDCTPRAECARNKCTYTYRKTCLKFGAQSCKPQLKCMLSGRKCVKLPVCVKHGAPKCHYPRKCVKHKVFCRPHHKCVSKSVKCTSAFSQNCLDCSKKVQPCLEAKKTASNCVPACNAQCQNDQLCRQKCFKGCKRMYAGFLSACKRVCSDCLIKRKVCHTDCKKTVLEKKCNRKCAKWMLAGQQKCAKPCVQKGIRTRCNVKSCLKYDVQPKKCRTPCIKKGQVKDGKKCHCLRYHTHETSKCRNKCTTTKCSPDCAPTFHKTCIKRAPTKCYRPKKCPGKRITKCTSVRKCKERGALACHFSKKCAAYKDVCKPKRECAGYTTTCVHDFTPACVQCAAKTHSCVEARKTSETCIANCVQSCGTNRICLNKCDSGCKAIKTGLLSQCKAQCPSCDHKTTTCHKTCRSTHVINKCTKTCIKHVPTTKKICSRPCTRSGMVQRCTKGACSVPYVHGKLVCVKPCLSYSTYATKWCKPKCAAVKCKRLCTNRPKQTCVRHATKCSGRCTRWGSTCVKKQTCTIAGKTVCKNATKCVRRANKCSNVTRCAESGPRCQMVDTHACKMCKHRNVAAACGDRKGPCIKSCAVKCGSGNKKCLKTCSAGCTAMTAGFKAACTKACPMCAKQVRSCKTGCLKSTVRRVCQQVCVKTVTLPQRHCVKQPCRAMGVVKQCKTHQCLQRDTKGPTVCRKVCAKHVTQTHETCATDCAAEPSRTYRIFKAKQAATLARRTKLRKCLGVCYARRGVCPGATITTCQGVYQRATLQCVQACQHPGRQVQRRSVCLQSCGAKHPASAMAKCKAAKCGGLVGVKQRNCHRRCVEASARCRCACEVNKEYVCKGYKCKCRLPHTLVVGEAAVGKAAAQVARAAVHTANGVINAHSGSGAGVGAHKTAAAAVSKAKTLGGDVDTSKLQDAVKRAKHRAHMAKLAASRLAALRRVMAHQAQKAADSEASKPFNGVAEQHSATLKAAKRAATAGKAAKVIKSVTLAAMKRAEATAKAKALAQKSASHVKTAAMVKAAHVAQRDTQAKIEKMALEEAQIASTKACKKFAVHRLSAVEKGVIFKMALKAARTAADAMLKTNKDRTALLAHAQKAATAATQSKILKYVTKLTNRLTSAAMKNALHHHRNPSQSKATAVRVAGLAAHKALKTLKGVVRQAAVKAVDDALHKVALDKKAAMAKTVKNAIDKTHSEKAAKTAAKQAIMKSVREASNKARKEAEEKGKTKKKQAEAAQKAAAAALHRGRGVQKVVKGVTTARSTPVVRVKVSNVKAAPAATGKSAAPKAVSAAQDKGSPATASKVKSTGTMVMEAVVKQGSQGRPAKKTTSHLEALVQGAAHRAAAHAKANGSLDAHRAAKVAAKKAVLSVVRTAAAVAALKTKQSLNGKSRRAQQMAAAAAATAAAKNVLSIAKTIVKRVTDKYRKRPHVKGKAVHKGHATP